MKGGGQQCEGDHEHRSLLPSSESDSNRVEQRDRSKSVSEEPFVEEGRVLRSGSRQYNRHKIRIGPDRQAEIPEMIPKAARDASPCEIQDDILMWAPAETQDDDLNEFLAILQEESTQLPEPNEEPSFPKRANGWDEEEALQLLLHCGYDYREAILVGASFEVFPRNQWSTEECENFEMGLRTFGKEFSLIQLNQVPTKSLAEVVDFYYFWKKSVRHDQFVNESKFDPKAADLMDEFLDELQLNSEQSSNESSPRSIKHQGNDSVDDSRIPSSHSELCSSSLQDMGDRDLVVSQQFVVNISDNQAKAEMDD